MPAMSPDRPAVLVVDDDNLIRGVLRKLVSMRGCTVFEAANAALAVTACQKLPVQLVFLDIYLPDANGLDIMAQMFASRPQLKVALISSDPTQFDLPQAQHEHIIDCIGKPFSPERIERVLHTAFPQLKLS
jgi:DNA-binding NtrC family response regulator